MGEQRSRMKYSTAVALVLSLSYATAGTVGGWNVPSGWTEGNEYVVVKSGNQVSDYGGYIFPGPATSSPAPSQSSIVYESPDGYYCEAKHYDANYGIFKTQECANAWTKLTTQGDAANLGSVDFSACATVASRPCGCQGLCRPVECTTGEIAINNAGTTTTGRCDYELQCRRQQELGLVTSCAEQATFQISMWFGIICAVVITFVSYAMMNMSLDMDSLLYTVGDPDKKDN